MSVLVRLLAALAATGGLLLGGIFAYHWSRIRECERPLKPLVASGATLDQITKELGKPWEIAGPSDAGRYTARWPLGEAFESRVLGSRETLAYIDGEFVFFLHLGNDGRAKSLTCIGN